MKMPMCRPCSSGSPQNTGSRAPGTTSFETGIDCCVGSLFCSGPPSPNRYDADVDRRPVEHDRRDHLVGARSSPSAGRRCPPTGRRPGSPRRSPGRCAGGSACPSNDEPTQTAPMLPTRYWPWPPMLNRPARNANATARPVRISGVVRISVCCRFSAASVRSSPVTHGNSQFSPEPVEDRLVGVDRVGAGERDDDPADEERDQRGDDRDDDPAAAQVARQPRGDGDRRLPALVARPHQRHAGTCPPSIATPSSSSRRVGRQLGHDPALVDHEHAVGERADLLQLERDEQHAAAGVALLEQPPVDELDRADVEPARRLRGDRDLRLLGELARDDDLLLVAARQRAGRVSGSPPRTSYCSSSGSACCSIRFGESRPKRLSGARRYSRSARFSASEKSSTRPRRWRSSAMWPTPAASAPRTPVPVMSRPPTRTWPACAGAQAGDRLDELGLAVAVDARDADDLARARRGARARAARAARGRRATSRPSTSSSGSPVACGAPSRPGRARRGRPSAWPGSPRSRPRSGRCRSSCRAAARSRGRRSRAPRAACAR